MGRPPWSHGLLASTAACTGAPAHAFQGLSRLAGQGDPYRSCGLLASSTALRALRVWCLTRVAPTKLCGLMANSVLTVGAPAHACVGVNGVPDCGKRRISDPPWQSAWLPGDRQQGRDGMYYCYSPLTAHAPSNALGLVMDSDSV